MKKKYKMAAGLILLVAIAAGCSTKEPENTPAVVTEVIQDTEKETGSERKEDVGKDEVPGSEAQPKENDDINDVKEKGHIIVPDEGEEHLGGNVRNLGDNSVTVSKIFMEENGNGDIAYLPGEGSQDEELVTVNFTDDTEFQYWVIQGSGGNIDMRGSSFSEIKEDDNLEMYGKYDGDTFIASKVIIEVYE